MGAVPLPLFTGVARPAIEGAMRIFYAFLILVTAAILFMLPVSEAIYDFRTDLKTDALPSYTAPGETTDNLTLTHQVYDNDTSSIIVFSSDSDDLPVLSAYDHSSHSVLLSGLSENTTRSMEISYDIYALSGWNAVDVVVSRVNLIWFLCIIAFIPAAIVVIFRGRA